MPAEFSHAVARPARIAGRPFRAIEHKVAELSASWLPMTQAGDRDPAVIHGRAMMASLRGAISTPGETCNWQHLAPAPVTIALRVEGL